MQLLPLEADFSFEDNVPFFFRGSLGLIGMYKKWVAEALALAYQKQNKYLTTEDMNATVYSDARLKIC